MDESCSFVVVLLRLRGLSPSTLTPPPPVTAVVTVVAVVSNLSLPQASLTVVQGGYSWRHLRALSLYLSSQTYTQATLFEPRGREGGRHPSTTTTFDRHKCSVRVRNDELIFFVGPSTCGEGEKEGRQRKRERGKVWKDVDVTLMPDALFSRVNERESTTTTDNNNKKFTLDKSGLE